MKLNMSLLIKNDVLLEKYNELWDKVSKAILLKTEPVYKEKYLRTKIKPYEGKISSNFYDIPKEDSNYICLSVILIDSVFWIGKKILSSSACRRT